MNRNWIRKFLYDFTACFIRGKRIVLFTIAGTIVLSSVAHAVQMPLSVRESVVIKENIMGMLGSNFEWEPQFEAFLEHDLQVDSSYAQVMENYSLPSARMAGSSSRVFQWKSAVGPYENRLPQFNGYKDVKMRYGVLEWINHIKMVNPEVKLTYVLNMETDTCGNAADLAEFFLGDGTVNDNGCGNWAELRKEYGVKEPVLIDIWELGNEVDSFTVLGPMGMRKEDYVNKAEAYISAVKNIDPNAVFAACGHRATGTNSAEAWEWNRYILEHLGDQIDYLTVHLYYTQYDIVNYQDTYMDALGNMINEISPNVKLYYSEHAAYINNFSDSEIVNRTHGIYGTLATSEFFNRIMVRPEVGAANYHCLYSPN